MTKSPLKPFFLNVVPFAFSFASAFIFARIFLRCFLDPNFRIYLYEDNRLISGLEFLAAAWTALRMLYLLIKEYRA